MTEVPQHALDDAVDVLQCALSGDTDAVVGTFDAVVDRSGVARFVSAYVNGDFSTGEALFNAAIADGQLPDCLLALAGSTVATLRHRAA